MPRKPKRVNEETSAGLEVGRRLANHALEEGPAVESAVVGGGLRVVPLALGRRRHLGRARADQIESQPGHRREAIAESHVDALGHPVPRGIVARAPDGLGTDVGGDHVRARARGEDGRETRPRSDLEDAFAALHAPDDDRRGASRPWAAEPLARYERCSRDSGRARTPSISVAHARGVPVTRAYTSR